MAPITQPSQPNISKTAHPASWSFSGILKSPKNSGSQQDRQTFSSTSATTSRPHNPITENVPEELRPVLSMAERVGREVEDFAEKLDKWNEQRQKGDNHVIALGLLDDCREIANKAVATLKRRHGAEWLKRAEQIWAVRARSLQNQELDKTRDAEELNREFPRTTAVRDLEQWQQEADTWELLQIILKSSAFVDDAGESPDNLLNDSAKETPGTENLWEDFLAQNPLARERHLITKWLESTAEHTGNDLGIIAARLEERAGRSSGTWSHGPLATREHIKGAKRLRSGATLTKDLNDFNLVDPKTGRSLVSTLDPDSKFREGSLLDGADEFFERSLWLTCWELVRRGKPLSQVREWLAERHENWRSISLGAATVAEQSVTKREIFARSLWRRTCIIASNNNRANEYERAVYGLLGGSSSPVEVVCRDSDDIFYAGFKEQLASDFEDYLRTYYPNHFPEALQQLPIEEPMKLIDGVASASLSTASEERPLHDEAIGADARAPLKMIQGDFIRHQPMTLVSRLSAALLELKTTDGRMKYAESLSMSLPQQDCMLNFAMDPQALRVMTHVVLILQDLDPELFDSDDEMQSADGIVVAYIELLTKARKFELIPLYASRLRRVRPESIVARVLPVIQTPREQRSYVKLLQTYNLDVFGVLTAQYEWLLSEGNMTTNSSSSFTLDLLEPESSKIWPGQRIKSEFYRSGVEDNELAVIQSLEWFLLVDGYWVDTFKILATAMENFLREGRIAAAMTLCERLPTKTISELKTVPMLDTSIDVWAEESAEDLLDALNTVHSSAAKLHHLSSGAQQKLCAALRSQSKTYRDLEVLANALRAFQEWRAAEDEALELEKSMSRSQLVDKTGFQGVYDDVLTCIQPLLKEGWLLNAVNPNEMEGLRLIRNIYVPSVILAYNSVLGMAVQIFGRDAFLQSLELVNIIGSNAHNIKPTTPDSGLAAAFIETGTMELLVTSMAWMSNMLISSNQQASKMKKKSKKRGANGETLSIWDLNAPMCPADDS